MSPVLFATVAIVIVATVCVGCAAVLVWLLRRRTSPWQHCIHSTSTALGIPYTEGATDMSWRIDNVVGGLRVVVEAIAATDTSGGAYRTRLSITVPGGEGLCMASPQQKTLLELLPGERKGHTGDPAFDKAVVVYTLDPADAQSRLDFFTRGQALEQIRAGWRFEHGSWVYVDPLLMTDADEVIGLVRPCLGAARALQAVHPDAVKRLVAMGRQDPLAEVRLRAVEILAESDVDLADLAGYLDDPDPWVAAGTARAFAARGDRAAIDLLQQHLLKAKDADLSQAIVEAITALRATDSPAPPREEQGDASVTKVATTPSPATPRRRSLIK